MRISDAILSCIYCVTYLVLTIDGKSYLENKDASFDHFVFTQTWAPQFCKEIGSECKFSHIPPIWTIHGLWPNEGSSIKFPSFCVGEEFNLNLLSGLRIPMDAYWFSYLQSWNNSDFWKHEWRKHGTCAVAGESELFPNQESYFSLTIQDIYPKYNISSILEDSDIVPGGRYSTERILAAFNSVLDGHTPGLMCTHDCISAVRICLDRDINPISCKHFNCPHSYLNYSVYQ